MPTPKHRCLRGYAIDPGFSTRLDTMGINECLYKVRWEDKLLPGPIGEYIEVIDLDPVNFCFYEPVDLDDKSVLAMHGLAPSEGNAQFHQQFVYAVIMQTIDNFEKALGRKIIWRRNLGSRNRKSAEPGEYVERLRIYPHAMTDSNAFYTADKVSLVFGYFRATNNVQGTNFPGGAVFTCLSPDIVAHETTHAILDSIHPRYMENTNPDVPAFHEAFADIVALLQRFGNKPLLEHQIEQARGKLDNYNVMGELATQFGQAVTTGRGALRSAIGQYDERTGKWIKREPDPRAYKQTLEAHDRGAILVATIFEAFVRLYNFRVQDLLRIATQGTGILAEGALHPDLIKRLAAEASDISAHLLSICIRAIDYCPPVDITFGDYLQALITADADLSPEDSNGYRVVLIDAFRSWGIFPDRVNSLSTYSLLWQPPQLSEKEDKAMELIAGAIKEDIRTISRLIDRRKIAAGYKDIQQKLHQLLTDRGKLLRQHLKRQKINMQDWKELLRKLGILDKSKRLTVRYDDSEYYFEDKATLEIHNVKYAFRMGRDDQALQQVIITLTQTNRVRIPHFETVAFRGGCTIILRMENDELRLDYIVLKRLDDDWRLQRQADYQFGADAATAVGASSYDHPDQYLNLSIENLHLH